MKPIPASRRLLFPGLLSAVFAALLVVAPTAAWAVCGDGNLEEFEECDDGNLAAGDCCDPECKADPVESFCTDNNQCTFDFCDGFGFCSSFPDQQADCDDGNDCTPGDFCNSDGFCVSDGTLEDGSTCFDANLCGGSGQCFNGLCGGDPADCSVFDNACNKFDCNVENRLCEGTQLDDGTTCDNPSTCTDPGTCMNGECQQPPTDCSSFADECHDAGCDVEAGGCYSIPKEDGSPCDDNNGCTDPGTCKSGECATTPKDCSSFEDQCNDAACDPKTEVGCFGLPKDDGTTCNDGMNCTTGDVCTTGTCGGTPVDCSGAGNDCSIGFCDPQTGECDSFPIEGPAECDDGNPCTEGEVCRSGTCGGGTPVDCSGFGDQCNTGVCNVQTGACEAVPNQNGGECDDGDKCTNGDTCTGGVCGGTTLDCTELDDQCKIGVCNGETGECESVLREEPQSCNDGSPCTENDTCSDGVCEGTPKDCSSFDTACTTGACGRSGECFAVPKEDGDSCDDGDPCTTGDNCNAGTCSGTPFDCSEFDDQCNVGVCNGDTGGCDTVPREEPLSCNDGSPCTENDACNDGVCEGTPKDCSNFDTACTTGACGRSGECFAVPNEDGDPCDDGDKCTTGDDCTAGQCGGTPIDCSGSSDQCNVGVCNGDTGGCESEPIGPEECDDGNTCSTGDTCSNGACVGTPLDCSVFDGACVEGVCNPGTGSCEGQPLEDGTTCDDGSLCTTSDQCGDGTCAGTPKDCSASGGNCLVGQCNPDTGQCEGDPVEDGTGCNDGDLCTQEDVCADGQCVGDPITCKPSLDPCRESFCNAPVGQCEERNADNGTECTDGSLCTTGDVCTDGTCSGTTTDCSNLDDSCNTGQCSLETGNCAKVPRENGTSCSDGDECTVGDSCTAGACTSGPPKDCSSLDAPCRNGVCNTRSGECEAVNEADDSPCDDGAFCTATDKCTGGVCSGTGDPCPGSLVCNGNCNESTDSCHAAAGTACESDGNPCTTDVCDGEGACVGEANDGACDDGLYCTTGDHCADKACVGDATCPQTTACGDTCDEANDACRTCGHPFSNSRCIVNAIFVLQGALSLRECELCTCDVDSSGAVMATDALLILKTCTNLPIPLDCPSGGSTTTTTTTSTTLDGGCEAALHNQVFNEKYTCVQTFTGGEPFCADNAEQDAIRFTHQGDGIYEVRDEPDTGFLYTGVFDCLTFTWNASEPGEYTESGVWTFSNDASSFEGSSAYVADDLSYAGACNETGAKSPSVPPTPQFLPPCPD